MLRQSLLGATMPQQCGERKAATLARREHHAEMSPLRRR